MKESLLRRDSCQYVFKIHYAITPLRSVAGLSQLISNQRCDGRTSREFYESRSRNIFSSDRI